MSKYMWIWMSRIWLNGLVAVVEVTVVWVKHYFLSFLLRNILPERAAHSKGAMIVSLFFTYLHCWLNRYYYYYYYKATGSRLCMWLRTLSNDLAYSSLFVNQTSRHSRAHNLMSHQYASGSWCEKLCACKLSCGVICECAHQWHRSIIDLFDNWNLLI